MKAMAKTNKDYLELILEMMQDNFKRLEKKVDDNTAETKLVHERAKRTNGRVNKNDERIAILETKIGKKFNWSLVDTRILTLWAVAVIIFLAIIARVLGVDFGGILG